MDTIITQIGVCACACVCMRMYIYEITFFLFNFCGHPSKFTRLAVEHTIYPRYTSIIRVNKSNWVTYIYHHYEQLSMK